MIYVVLKSTNKSGRSTVPEPIWGYNGIKSQKANLFINYKINFTLLSQ